MSSSKKLIIVIGLVILAVLLGYLGSKMVGPAERTDLPEESLEADVNEVELDADGNPLDGRELTGDEGESIDGVRVLGPNEATRVEDRDFFEGLENMEGAVPVGGTTGNRNEMDRVLDQMERQGAAAAGGRTPATQPGGANAGGGGSAAARPSVERPSDEMSDLLDSMEQGGQ